MNSDDFKDFGKKAAEYSWAHFADDWLENLCFIGLGYLIAFAVCKLF